MSTTVCRFTVGARATRTDTDRLVEIVAITRAAAGGYIYRVEDCRDGHSAFLDDSQLAVAPTPFTGRSTRSSW